MININYVGNNKRFWKVYAAMNKVHNEAEREYLVYFKACDISYSVDVKQLDDLLGIIKELKPADIKLFKYGKNGAPEFLARY